MSWGSVTGPPDVTGVLGGWAGDPSSQSNLMSLGSSGSWDDPEPTTSIKVQNINQNTVDNDSW